MRRVGGTAAAGPGLESRRRPAPVLVHPTPSALVLHAILSRPAPLRPSRCTPPIRVTPNPWEGPPGRHAGRDVPPRTPDRGGGGGGRRRYETVLAVALGGGVRGGRDGGGWSDPVGGASVVPTAAGGLAMSSLVQHSSGGGGAAKSARERAKVSGRWATVDDGAASGVSGQRATSGDDESAGGGGALRKKILIRHIPDERNRQVREGRGWEWCGWSSVRCDGPWADRVGARQGYLGWSE